MLKGWKLSHLANYKASGSITMSVLKKGLPQIHSKGDNLSFLEAVQALIKAMGRTLSQLSWVSWINLHRCLLIMSLAFSTFPEDRGLQEQCKCYFIPRASDTPWVTAALKAEPLSLWRPRSSTNQGMISWIKNFITSLACSLQQVKASTHSVKVSAQTCKQENLLLALE